ncbi:GntR family transcriptional regulator [Pseudonocardia parietis]|uniref:DNA-binding GntR family transcriptional regulator n=1 Tax=Pseudonocardia parietis TaxID=570936 RepID=A0ABS4VMA1_9PSEU|nr:GntR family transcriptional regulator [Pseudonocardia parietis]MBP2365054.1 DNA-binding GntR family transcriptional regulator [Pseudonocardia parietis]
MAQSRGGRNRLSDMAARFVREAIIAGRLREGEYLRPEQLADELEISVTPAREALLAIEGEGFVEMVPRRGFVVAPLDPDDILDIFTSQALICGELASRAALRMSDSEIAELEQLQDTIVAAAGAGDYETVRTANHQFHRAINLAANARKMLWLLAITLKYTPSSTYSQTTGWPEAACTDHRDILNALQNRDADAARTSMSAHMKHLGVLLAQHIGSLSPSAH